MARKAEVLFVGDAASIVRAAKQAEAAASSASKGIEGAHNRVGKSAKSAESVSIGAHAKIGSSFLSLRHHITEAAVGVAAAYASIEGVKGAIDKTEQLTNTTLSLTKVMGLSVKQASAWAAVAEVQGINTRSLNQAFGTLSKNAISVTAAADKQQVKIAALGNSHADAQKKTAILSAGLGKQADAFKALGITQSDLVKGRTDFQGLLDKVNAGFEKLPAGTQKAALGMQLMGRGWQTLVPLMKSGELGLEGQLETAKKMGATLSGSSVKSLEQFKVAQEKAKFGTLGLQLSIGQYLAPAITKIIGTFAGFISQIRSGTGFGGKLRDIVTDIAKTVGNFLSPVIATTIRLVSQLVAGFRDGTGAGGTLKAILVTAFGVVRTVILSTVTAIQGIVSWFQRNRTVAVALAGALGGAAVAITAIKVVTLAWAAATKAAAIAQGILNAIMALNPLVALGIAIAAVAGVVVALQLKTHFLTGAWQALKGAFAAVTDWIGGAATKAFAIVKTAAEYGLLGPVGLIITHWKDLVSFLKGAWKTISDGISTFATSIKNAIVGAFDGAVNTVIDFINDIIGAIDIIPGVNIKKIGHVGGSHGGGASAPSNQGSLTGQGSPRGVGTRATGGTLVKHPMFVVGEEAPVHPEYVIATNPAYRQRNMGLWADAGKKLGIPGFATGGVVSYGGLEALWDSAGGNRSLAPLMAAIAEAESRGNPNARNPSGASGLWQILGLPFPGDPFNPTTNARMAVAKYNTQGLGAWATYTSGAYKQFLHGGGSILGSIGNAISGVLSGGAGAITGLLPKVGKLPKWLAGMGSYMLSHVGSWIASKVSNIIGSLLPSGPGGGPVKHGRYDFPLPAGKWTPGAVDQGWDLAAPAHTPEFAIGPGVVIGHGISGFGQWAPILRLDQSIGGGTVYYGHAGPGNWTPTGTHVTQGQVISEIGAGIVGKSTGPHLEIGWYPPGGPGAGASMKNMLGYRMGGIPFVGSFKNGGTVPGSLGSAGLALVHGGEQITAGPAVTVAGMLTAFRGALYPIDAALTAIHAQEQTASGFHLQALQRIDAKLSQLKAWKDAIASLGDQTKQLASQAAQAWRTLQDSHINAEHDAKIAAIGNGADAKQLAAMQAQDVVAQNAATLAGLQKTLTDAQFLAKHSGGQTHLDALQQVKDAQDAITAYYRTQEEKRLQDNIDAATKAADDWQTTALAGVDQQTADYQAGLQAQFDILTGELARRKITYAQWAQEVNGILSSYGLSVTTDPSTEGAVSAGPGSTTASSTKPAAAGGRSIIGTALKNHPRWGGHRAAGGPVQPGLVYRVGEYGPEDVAFGQRGTVMSAGQSRGASVIIQKANFTGTRAARAFADRLAYRAAIGTA